MNTVAKTQIKSALDLALPGVAGFFVFRYFFSQNKKDPRLPILYAAVAALVVWLITRKITTSIMIPVQTVDNVFDLNTNGTAGQGQVSTAPAYDGGPLATRLRADIYSNGLRDRDLYRQIAALSNAQLIQVYNAYNKLFKVQDKEGMITAMSGENYQYRWIDAEMYGLTQNIMNRLRGFGATD